MTESQPTTFAKALKRSALLFKLALLAILVLLMLIPLASIRDVVKERQHYSREVKKELGAAWGGAQKVAGPVLALPIETLQVEKIANRREGPDEPVFIERESRRAEMLFLLPETQRIAAAVETQTRRRGLYEALLYTTTVGFEGDFAIPSRDVLGLEPETKVHWDRARLLAYVSDLSGSRNAPTLQWGDWQAPFKVISQTMANYGLDSGRWIAAPLPALAAGSTDLAYGFEIALTGSEALRLVPLGQTAEATLTADWPHPSFGGPHLPERSEIGADGFTASWGVSHLARGLAQVLRSDGGGIEALTQHIQFKTMTTRLIDPVDLYRKAERAVKYGILFIGLTFATLFIFEALGGVRLHLVQYGLVGLALSLFYLLLLSLAEHIGFALAFWSGAAACLAIVALYAAKVTASRTRGLVLGGLLAGIYAFLFLTLRSEDWALLMGSLLLLAFVAAIMFATRNLDWYALGEQAKGDVETPPAQV